MNASSLRIIEGVAICKTKRYNLPVAARVGDTFGLLYDPHHRLILFTHNKVTLGKEIRHVNSTESEMLVPTVFLQAA